MTDDRANSYIARTAAVLRALAEKPESGSVAELSRRLEISRSVVHRVLQELVAVGLASYLASERTYQLGPASVEFSLMVVDWLPIRRIARPFLYELRDIADESCGLFLKMGMRYGGVEQVLAGSPRAGSILGQARSLRYGASGRAILAFQPPEIAIPYLERVRQHPRSPEVGDDVDWVEAELARIREQGYSLSLGENGPGLSTLAFPVRAANGAVSAAVSLMGLAERWEERGMLHHVPECLDVIRRLEAQLAKGAEHE